MNITFKITGKDGSVNEYIKQSMVAEKLNDVLVSKGFKFLKSNTINNKDLVFEYQK